MSVATHAVTMNGRISGELKAWDGDLGGEIRRRVALLDGVERFSLGLWALPPGVPLDRVKFEKWPQEYIQAAGSQERLIVEVRRLEGGRALQCAVGRDGPPRGTASEKVRWNGCESWVFPNEVFDAAEAGEVFVSYYSHGSVPAGYVCRTISF